MLINHLVRLAVKCKAGIAVKSWHPAELIFNSAWNLASKMNRASLQSTVGPFSGLQIERA